MLLAFAIVLFTIAVYMGLDAVTVRQKQIAGSLARARASRTSRCPGSRSPRALSPARTPRPRSRALQAPAPSWPGAHRGLLGGVPPPQGLYCRWRPGDPPRLPHTLVQPGKARRTTPRTARGAPLWQAIRARPHLRARLRSLGEGREPPLGSHAGRGTIRRRRGASVGPDGVPERPPNARRSPQAARPEPRGVRRADDGGRAFSSRESPGTAPLEPDHGERLRTGRASRQGPAHPAGVTCAGSTRAIDSSVARATISAPGASPRDSIAATSLRRTWSRAAASSTACAPAGMPLRRAP